MVQAQAIPIMIIPPRITVMVAVAVITAGKKVLHSEIISLLIISFN
jgi:hypothetical protein